ncbi:MAG: hypothetical protein QXP91_13175 [Candidatus Methanomethylicia archaeon]
MESESKGLFIRCSKEEADTIRRLAEKENKTIKDFIIDVVKQYAESKGLGKIEVENPSVNPLVAEAIDDSYDWFGNFHIEYVGKNLLLRGITKLSESDKEAIFERYDGHARFWGNSAETIYKDWINFLRNWRNREPSTEEVTEIVSEFYIYRQKMAKKEE